MTYEEATALARRANAMMKHQDAPDGYIWAQVAFPRSTPPARASWEVHVVFDPHPTEETTT